MRLFNSTLYTAFALSLLTGCSGNMAATPSAAVPGAAMTNAAASNRYTTRPNAKNGALEVVALQTSDGDYVTAVGPPIAEPGCGAAQVALHDNATRIGPEEKFTMVNEGNNVYAFRLFQTPYYITAVNGGGMGGPDAAYGYSQLNTIAMSVGSSQIFNIVREGEYVALQTIRSNNALPTYVSAIPGCGTINTVPFHTNATIIGPWERFTVVPE